ncbi:hypothetical protein [Flavisolibacter tropicus]|uniref:Outer membrane protein beta-barrel domain-containing protein n=1 Tax=Flavisolibacter tropicus TaxID=1492898 RepID=A0A172TVI0_9BACT|nr:hypothetical protein [Flavisolibacter tropicus]ANE50747.1 hypothetical protein SY85_09800 [Flavisolibacter tropicus]
MKTAPVLYILLLLFGSSSCAVIPISNHFEKAGTLKKGNVEIQGNMSTYGSFESEWGEDGTSFSSNSISMIGGRVGIGLSDKTDLKLRFEKTINANRKEFNRQHYFSIGPKFALVDDKVSLLLPFGIYNYQNDFWKEITCSIAPQFLFTFTSPDNKADLTLSAKSDILLYKDGGTISLGGSVGMGFSSDLSKWAIRPELGTFFIGGASWSFGLGFQYIILKKKK